MHCESCVSRITRALEQVEGVHSTKIDLASNSALITRAHDTPTADILTAIESAGSYTGSIESPNEAQGPDPTAATRESLYPLYLIVAFLAGITVLTAFASNAWSVESLMRTFMAGFFITFAFFKLLDPPGFVSAFRMYDIPARHSKAWAYFYPFVEITLGALYLLALIPLITNIITLTLMLVGAAGVLQALRRKQQIRCACLGTALNLPMTKVTLIEDLTMAAMAAFMLVLHAT